MDETANIKTNIKIIKVIISFMILFYGGLAILSFAKGCIIIGIALTCIVPMLVYHKRQFKIEH